MDIHTIRQQLRTKSIYELPLRVTYYARVSSESDEQLNSLDNQITYYENLIRQNQNWTFVPGYIDEGLSGISTKKRENFNRMIADAAEDRQAVLHPLRPSLLPQGVQRPSGSYQLQVGLLRKNQQQHRLLPHLRPLRG